MSDMGCETKEAIKRDISSVCQNVDAFGEIQEGRGRGGGGGSNPPVFPVYFSFWPKYFWGGVK